MTSIQFFIDFDGTITRSDVVDIILERYGSSEWKKIEEEWSKGLIGSRECLSRQLALVTMKETELKDLLKKVEVDATFAPFVRRALQFNIPVTVVSDGFLTVIREILNRELKSAGIPAKKIRVYANDLKWTGSKISLQFPKGAPCEHGCANCKERILQKMTHGSSHSVFIGDGLSDRFGARISNYVFAKSKLLTYCRETKVPHKEFRDFSDIEKWLVDNFNPALSGSKRNLNLSCC